MKVNLYVKGAARGMVVERLADLIRQAYSEKVGSQVTAQADGMGIFV